MPNQYTKKEYDDTEKPKDVLGSVDVKEDTELKEGDQLDITRPKEETYEKKPPAKTGKKKTIIPLSGEKEAYEKAGLSYTQSPLEREREVFERQTDGVWTREVTKIIYYRDTNDKEYLDWSELRKGKTKMQRELETKVPHVGHHIEVVPNQKVVYDPEADENRLVNAGTVKEVKTIPGIAFSKEALDELVEDISKKKCEFLVTQEGMRPQSASKKELVKYSGKFEQLYNLKSNIKIEKD